MKSRTTAVKNIAWALAIVLCLLAVFVGLLFAAFTRHKGEQFRGGVPLGAQTKVEDVDDSAGVRPAPVGDGSLEADAVLPTEFEGQRAPLLIAQGRVAEVEAFGDSHFHRLALSREAKLVLQPERVVTCRCLQGNEQK